MKVLRIDDFKIREAKKEESGFDLWETCRRKADSAMEEFARGSWQVWDTDYPGGIVWEDDDRPESLTYPCSFRFNPFHHPFLLV